MLWYIYLFHGNKTRPASSSYEMLTDSVIFGLIQTPISWKFFYIFDYWP